MKRNALKKRFFRELKSEFGKYLVIFLFLTGAIGFVSGFLVASDSMLTAYDESFTKYNVEDGNFELTGPPEEIAIDRMHAENNRILIGDTLTVIGTLRAMGYTKRELVRHYLTLPMTVVTFAAVVGNVLGYTAFKYIAATMYYKSYSLPTYVTLWNGAAFLQTTLIPVIIMFLINVIMLE